jgi:hypothetical protein
MRNAIFHRIGVCVQPKRHLALLKNPVNRKEFVYNLRLGLNHYGVDV